MLLLYVRIPRIHFSFLLGIQFLFTRDSAGNEVDQIYKFNYITGKHQLLTDGKAKHLTPIWSHKGDKFAFSHNIQNTRDFDIYLGTLKGEKSSQRILEKGGYWYPVDFSPDDKNLLVEKYISANESYYYVIDINKKTITQINPVDQKIAYGQARWAKNGEGIYLVSNQFSNFKQLLYFDLKTEHREILTKQIPWDIEEFELSTSGDTIAFVSNEDGITKLYFLNTKTRLITQAHLPDGLIYNLKFKPDGTQLAMVINTPTSPSDVYTLNLKEKKFIRWTYSEVAGIDTSNFSQAQLIHYQTFDSVDGEPRLIPAFYYKPTIFKPPYPVLIMCHGGPESQYTPGFYTITQFYLNEMGIAVIAPNIRGSSGYGKEYVALDNGYKREDAVKDIGALLDWIDNQPELDTSRICIEGGSYGGYMVLASMIHYSNRLRCGMESIGISSFVTFLENTGKYRQDLRRVEYGDEQEQIVKAVRKNGVDVWYLLAEDEGHGFAKKSNRDFYIQAQILFLEKYLLK
jgi:dipeptidyl aminopeptidase/acylaminoacyl peptidase